MKIPGKEYIKEIIQRFKGSKVDFKEGEDGLIVRDFDNIKIRMICEVASGDRSNP